MSEIWSKVRLKMPTEKDYKRIEIFIKKLFDDEDHWPVQNYDEDNWCINIKEVLASKDDVIGFAKALNEQLLKYGNKQEDPDIGERIKKTSFTMDGTTTYSNSGECVDYVIEKKENDITIKETDNYTLFGEDYFSDYEDFCDTIEDICPDVSDIISEDEFDPECEYAVTYTNVYADTTPEYGKPYSIEKSRDKGTISSVDDEIIEYLKENNLPYDDDTIENLSVEDVYAIMAGTYGKKDSES